MQIPIPRCCPYPARPPFFPSSRPHQRLPRICLSPKVPWISKTLLKTKHPSRGICHMVRHGRPAHYPPPFSPLPSLIGHVSSDPTQLVFSYIKDNQRDVLSFRAVCRRFKHVAAEDCTRWRLKAYRTVAQDSSIKAITSAFPNLRCVGACVCVWVWVGRWAEGCGRDIWSTSGLRDHLRELKPLEAAESDFSHFMLVRSFSN